MLFLSYCLVQKIETSALWLVAKRYFNDLMQNNCVRFVNVNCFLLLLSLSLVKSCYSINVSLVQSHLVPLGREILRVYIFFFFFLRSASWTSWVIRFLNRHPKLHTIIAFAILSILSSLSYLWCFFLLLRNKKQKNESRKILFNQRKVVEELAWHIQDPDV